MIHDLAVFGVPPFSASLRSSFDGFERQGRPGYARLGFNAKIMLFTRRETNMYQILKLIMVIL